VCLWEVMISKCATYASGYMWQEVALMLYLEAERICWNASRAQMRVAIGLVRLLPASRSLSFLMVSSAVAFARTSVDCMCVTFQIPDLGEYRWQ
jgi:hypothetical protein